MTKIAIYPTPKPYTKTWRISVNACWPI